MNLYGAIPYSWWYELNGLEFSLILFIFLDYVLFNLLFSFRATLSYTLFLINLVLG